jgi:hypothetical protein
VILWFTPRLKEAVTMEELSNRLPPLIGEIKPGGGIRVTRAPAEKNPFGDNRKARRQLAAKNRREDRAFRKAVTTLTSPATRSSGASSPAGA